MDRELPEDFKNQPTFVLIAVFGGTYGLSTMGTFLLGHPVELRASQATKSAAQPAVSGLGSQSEV